MQRSKRGIVLSKVDAILEAANNVLCGNVGMAKDIINSEYPFKHIDSTTRKYTDNEKMTQFIKDGFMDRYSGDRLLNPGLLKVLSYYMPDEFPYHPHWKMEECHNAYWEFVPTLDHVYPVALGGADDSSNWATTSMLHNSIKNNWTLEQLQWKLYDAGDIAVWDGLTSLFVQLVEKDEALLLDAYIKKWYKLSKNMLG